MSESGWLHFVNALHSPLMAQLAMGYPLCQHPLAEFLMIYIKTKMSIYYFSCAVSTKMNRHLRCSPWIAGLLDGSGIAVIFWSTATCDAEASATFEEPIEYANKQWETSKWNLFDRKRDLYSPPAPFKFIPCNFVHLLPNRVRNVIKLIFIICIIHYEKDGVSVAHYKWTNDVQSDRTYLGFAASVASQKPLFLWSSTWRSSLRSRSIFRALRMATRHATMIWDAKSVQGKWYGGDITANQRQMADFLGKN